MARRRHLHFAWAHTLTISHRHIHPRTWISGTSLCLSLTLQLCVSHNQVDRGIAAPHWKKTSSFHCMHKRLMALIAPEGHLEAPASLHERAVEWSGGPPSGADMIASLRSSIARLVAVVSPTLSPRHRASPKSRISTSRLVGSLRHNSKHPTHADSSNARERERETTKERTGHTHT